MRNKKMTMAVLALAVVMLFGACGGDDAEKISGGITPAVVDELENEDADVTEGDADATTDATEGEVATDADEVTDTPEATAEPEATNIPEATEAPEVTGKTTSLGRVQGGMYVNEYMGVSCTLDSGWEFYTAEELQEFPENVAEMFEGTDMEDEMSQMSYITDMSAENQEDFTSMNIIYEKLDLQQRLMLGSLSSSDIVDSMLLYQKETLVTTYAQAGINVLDMAKKSVEFCGETIDGLYMSCDVSGIPYYTLQIFDYSLGDYAVTLTLASFVEDKTAELATLYAKYE